MSFIVYILKSTITHTFYCGQTDNINERLNRHNRAEVKSTKHALPWLLIGYIKCETRSEAMALEKQIKKRGIQRWLITNEQKLIK